ncbi:MAG: hypothetical protein Q7R96_03315 [Nanoarchaeota archaeon]|nr:hypothetical protein [Nanoarchaeota archaeon]
MVQIPNLVQKIDQFISNLDVDAKEVARGRVSVPAVPDDLQEGVIQLQRHGWAHVEMGSKIEALRQDLGIDYRSLLPLLRTRLGGDYTEAQVREAEYYEEVLRRQIAVQG